jgi:hypothetical protein
MVKLQMYCPTLTLPHFIQGVLEDRVLCVPQAKDAQVSRIFLLNRGTVLLVCYRENHQW